MPCGLGEFKLSVWTQSQTLLHPDFFGLHTQTRHTRAVQSRRLWSRPDLWFIGRSGARRVSPAPRAPTRTGRALASAARALSTPALTPGAATARAWPSSCRTGTAGAWNLHSSTSQPRRTSPRATRSLGPTRRAHWCRSQVQPRGCLRGLYSKIEHSKSWNTIYYTIPV